MFVVAQISCCRIIVVSKRLNMIIKRSFAELSSVLAVLLLGLVGCGSGGDNSNIEETFSQTPTVEPIASVVKTAVPLGYAASVAMAEVNGIDIANASSSNTCSTYPCLATIVLTVTPETFPVAVEGVQDNGEIIIVGLWNSANDAILTVIFRDLSAGNGFLSIQKISTIPVNRQLGKLRVVYASVDIDIDVDSDNTIELSEEEIQQEYERLSQSIPEEPEIGVDMDAWMIEVDQQQTADSLADDKYRILGGGQYFDIAAGSISTLQLGVAELLFSADCSLNPTSGLAVLQEVEVGSGERATWPKIGQALIEFHPECDGKAKVLLGTGSFFLISGDLIDLGF